MKSYNNYDEMFVVLGKFIFIFSIGKNIFLNGLLITPGNGRGWYHPWDLGFCFVAEAKILTTSSGRQFIVTYSISWSHHVSSRS